MPSRPPLLRLVYMSQAHRSMPLEALSSLLVKARAANEARLITGALLYQDQVFFQLLEGPEEEVRALYSKIKQDPRHFGCQILLDYQTNERLFPDWSMGHASATPAQVRAIPGLNGFFTRSPSAFHLDAKDVNQLLDLFREGLLTTNPA
jgi:hypothetical protein